MSLILEKLEELQRRLKDAHDEQQKIYDEYKEKEDESKKILLRWSKN
jgi:hypothetical protein